MRAVRLAMASPLIINSSSPNSIRLPTNTPPSRRSSNGRHVSTSSPGLPSPSAFTKFNVTALKGGSPGQAIPANARFGFATAGSLWRESKQQEDGVDNEIRQVAAAQTGAATAVDKRKTKEAADGHGEVNGKLKKPKRPPGGRRNASRTAEPLVCDEVRTLETEPSVQRDPARGARKSSKQDASSRKPSMGLSALAFGVYDLGMLTQAPAAVSAKAKSKKTTTSNVRKTEGDAEGRPRKRRPKSEAVVLNSDDPIAEASVAKEITNKTSAAPAKPKKKRASKAKAAATNAESIERSDATKDTSKPAPSQAQLAATEKPAYFAKAPSEVIVTAHHHWEIPTPQRSMVDTEQSPVNEEFGVLAAPRKLDWTPVKDSEGRGVGTSRQAANSPSTSAGPKLQLTELLGGFGYFDANAKKGAVERAGNGEAVTKRRRIELAEAAGAVPAPRKSKVSSNTGEPKLVKKPAAKKKLQTITALATSAYQPVAVDSPDQSTVSEFFAPRKDTAPRETETLPVVEKPKKPRKPRQKKGDVGEGDETAIAQPKKAKKVKVKFNEPDFRMKLYSPARATVQMQQQDFLFGTSSQLAVDESPAFIRDTQIAVLASEIDPIRAAPREFDAQVQSSQVAPSQFLITPRRSKSCAKVPTAPHGTNLSLPQAHRELWCVSSRDHDGGFLRDSARADEYEAARLPTIHGYEQDQPLIQHPPTQNAELMVECEPATGGQQTDEQNLPHDQEVMSHAPDVRSVDGDNNQQAIVDLSNTSPVATEETVEESASVLNDNAEHLTQPQQRGPLATTAAEQAAENDAWMLLSSDGPEPHKTLECSDNARSSKVDPGVSRPRIRRDAGHYFSPARHRNVLQPLDANASMSLLPGAKDMLPTDARAFSTTTSNLQPKSPTGRPRGRQRNDTSNALDSTASPERRGRPPKRSIIAPDPSPEAAKLEKPKAVVSASQPLRSPSGWLNVDEISDSDSPVTPSPPRRRASLSPPAVLPLNIAVEGSPLAKLKTRAPATVLASTSTFKPGEPQWPAIREQIFPQISATIKDAPRADASKPSYYQKILMYDPITLEELSGWLNEQGLRIQVQKPKAKKRGRKKNKNAEGSALVEESAEWEVHEEPLQPWMVQKWCEERSICCVWAAGGWGGRARH